MSTERKEIMLVKFFLKAPSIEKPFTFTYDPKNSTLRLTCAKENGQVLDDINKRFKLELKPRTHKLSYRKMLFGLCTIVKQSETLFGLKDEGWELRKTDNLLRM